MKKSLVIIFVILTIMLVLGCVTTTEAAPFIDIVDVPGKSAGELYIEINKWAVEVFQKANSVIEFSDKESATVSGKYSTSVFLGLLPVDVISTIVIEAKDEKYRIAISNPYYRDPQYPATLIKLTRAASIDKLREKWENVSVSLKDYIFTGREDW